MNRRTRRLWLLALVPAGPFVKPLVALTILTLLLGWFWMAGILSDDQTVSATSAIFFAVILAYVVPVFAYITAKTQQAFADLAPHLQTDAAQMERWRQSIDRKSGRWIVANLSLGLSLWLLHTLLLYQEPAQTVQPQSASALIAGVAGPLLVWLVMTCAIHALIDNALLFRRITQCVQIDLINPAPLTAFARVAVSSTLALIGAQAAFPIMLLDPDVPLAASVPGLVTTGAAMAALFILPIWPVHRALAAAKGAELQRVNALLHGMPAPLEQSSAQWDQFGSILLYRREIATVHEWPFDTGAVTRLAFYLIIPPLSWVGAAIIDVAVERLM